MHPNEYVDFFNKQIRQFPVMINSPAKGEFLVEKRRFIYE